MEAPPGGVELLEALPCDVVQIALSHCYDTQTLARARLVCRVWCQAVHETAATVEASLPGNAALCARRLQRLHAVVPRLADARLTFAPGAPSQRLDALVAQLGAFEHLSALELRFSDALDVSARDAAALASLATLERLSLANVCLGPAPSLAPLARLPRLRALALAQCSKVAPLLTGDAALGALGALTGLEELTLRGRLCSVSDDGLMALAHCTRLRALSVSWVPWQSQISQNAALALLASLPALRALQLGGAELLLPHGHGASGGGTTAAAAALALAAGTASSAAAAALAQHMPGGAGSNGADAGAAVAGANMRRVLGGLAGGGLDSLQLRFNCCGTSVEKALLALGGLRPRLTGLTWSYAKLGGPVFLRLLGQCTSLRSLKLRLWYQDHALAEMDCDLRALSELRLLESAVVDKRPPFQQQLPAQQAAVRVPVSAATLSTLAAAWPKLRKLHLGLASSDFADDALTALAAFTNLRALGLFSYDAGWSSSSSSSSGSDAHYLLPLDLARLPQGLTKLDLLHMQLYHSGGGSVGAMSAADAAAAALASALPLPGLHGWRATAVAGAVPAAAAAKASPLARTWDPALQHAAAAMLPPPPPSPCSTPDNGSASSGGHAGGRSRRNSSGGSSSSSSSVAAQITELLTAALSGPLGSLPLRRRPRRRRLSGGSGGSASSGSGSECGSSNSNSDSASTTPTAPLAPRPSASPLALPQLQQLLLKHCALAPGVGLADIIGAPGELRVLQLHELVRLSPRDLALLPAMPSLRRLSMVAGRDDAWLGLAPLRLLARATGLRQLEWVPCERALPARLRAGDVGALAALGGGLHSLALPMALGRCDQLRALSEQLAGSCQLRLYQPVYCEHASGACCRGSRIGRLLSAGLSGGCLAGGGSGSGGGGSGGLLP